MQRIGPERCGSRKSGGVRALARSPPMSHPLRPGDRARSVPVFRKGRTARPVVLPNKTEMRTGGLAMLESSLVRSRILA